MLKPLPPSLEGGLEDDPTVLDQLRPTPMMQSRTSERLGDDPTVIASGASPMADEATLDVPDLADDSLPSAVWWLLGGGIALAVAASGGGVAALIWAV